MLLHKQMVKELPQFSEDLRTSREQKGLSTQYFYDFKVYTDGEQPRQTLAKKWLCKIIDKINTKDCYKVISQLMLGIILNIFYIIIDRVKTF